MPLRRVENETDKRGKTTLMKRKEGYRRRKASGIEGRERVMGRKESEQPQMQRSIGLIKATKNPPILPQPPIINDTFFGVRGAMRISFWCWVILHQSICPTSNKENSLSCPPKHRNHDQKSPSPLQTKYKKRIPP